MRITLDQDTWTIADDVPFADALTELSNRARADARLVTALTVGGRPLTDRDLHPSLLQEPVGRLGPVEATTQTVAAVLRSADASARRMAETLHAEGAKLAVALRGGGQGFAALDAWLGGLADYLEWLSQPGRDAEAVERAGALSRCVEELLEARAQVDLIRAADGLEYELLPRLAPRGVA